MDKNRPILLVEDDKIDVMTIRKAFTEINIINKLDVVPNGEEALKYLVSGQPHPCLILLDLNMPRMNGIEFLKAVKQDEELKKIPVVVLTTSEEDSDIFASYQLGVAGYIVKPVDYKKFVDVVRQLNLYWSISLSPVD